MAFFLPLDKRRRELVIETPKENPLGPNWRFLIVQTGLEDAPFYSAPATMPIEHIAKKAVYALAEVIHTMWLHDHSEQLTQQIIEAMSQCTPD